MQTYISFLRSVNMAGHNLIKMTELANLFIDIGFGDAKTYIQSGNVIFSHSGDKSLSSLSDDIEIAILKKFNLSISVMTRRRDELVKLGVSNHFLVEPDFDPSKMAVIFLHETPLDTQIQKVARVDFPPDKFKIIGDEIFIYCPNGFGRTKLYTGFFEKKMGVTGTARNWKTITTILNLTDKKDM
jgi:uncharacterized protein (DUF1697 family)